MKVSERFRRFWLGESPADHPLSEEERDWSHEHPAHVYDELAEEADHRAGAVFDPDARKGTS
jgi:hypothetical protein